MSDSGIKVLESSAMFMGPGEGSRPAVENVDYLNTLMTVGHVITLTDAQFIGALLKHKADSASREAARESEQRRLIRVSHDDQTRIKQADDLLFAVLVDNRDSEAPLDAGLIRKIHDWLKEDA